MSAKDWALRVSLIDVVINSSCLLYSISQLHFFALPHIISRQISDSQRFEMKEDTGEIL